MMDSLDNCQQRAQAAKTFIESRMQEFQVLLEYHHHPFSYLAHNHALCLKVNEKSIALTKKLCCP